MFTQNQDAITDRRLGPGAVESGVDSLTIHIDS